MTKEKAETPYVTVDIYDQAYHLSGQDLAQVRALAARVDDRMRAVASHGRTADSLRVAVLAALNFADELTRAEEELSKLKNSLDVVEASHLKARATNLRGLLDIVLAEE
ncbi:cell division protein ZapA [Acidicapsa ligni]|uniref:cell division protein ZapA n=1 Tax=Acidicapsa ligni TaxID=542300 RepID=UPI0021DFAB82|nr:cell division protein ZapA [Acidicapsa ligni]